MRVIAGRARGTKLLALEGLETRPTLDRLKEVLFSIIQYELKDRVVLDAYAGSGALGIEALSRGALRVDFCEKNAKAFEVLKKNVIKTHCSDKASLHKIDVLSFLEGAKSSYDLILLDPPYSLGLVPKTLEILIRRELLNQGALIVIESERELDMSQFHPSLSLRKRRDYSTTSLSFFDYIT